MVVALSDETPDKVAEYIDELGITVRVASGFSNGDAFKVSGLPSATIIGPDGKIAWSGHPSSLSNGTVEAALKDAKPRSSNFLAVAPSKELSAKLAPVGKAMEQGKIGKALATLQGIATDGKSAAEEQAEAAALAAEIEGHVKLLNEQAEALVTSRSVLEGLTILDALSKELAAHELGTAAKSRAAQIRKDPVLAKELEAAEAFEKLRASVSKLSTSKAKDKYGDFVKKHEGTRAAERARTIANKKS